MIMEVEILGKIIGNVGVGGGSSEEMHKSLAG